MNFACKEIKELEQLKDFFMYKTLFEDELTTRKTL